MGGLLVRCILFPLTSTFALVARQPVNERARAIRRFITCHSQAA
jgi:hypothetical protein